MSFHFVTGKLGGGKSLVSVSRIKHKIEQGCMIATNIDLYLDSMFHAEARNLNVIRVPDKPCIFDLNAIGIGNKSYDESENGLLVLDECGSWFNSRNWQDKSRAAVNDWFRHARKLGWDVILIVQDISLIDNHARDALSEHVAFCRRLDNFQVPFIGSIYKMLTGSRLKMPKVHIARIVYGSQPADPVSDRWVYRGTDLYSAYDTKQIFTDDYPHGPHSLLTPWHMSRRTRCKRNGRFYMRLTKIYFKKLKAPLAVFSGVLAGLIMSFFMTAYMNDQFYQEYKKLQDAVQKLEQVSPGQVDNLSDQLAGNDIDLSEFDEWKIAGYANYSDDVFYDLLPPVLEKVGPDDEVPTISTKELSSSYSITALGPCHLRIASGGAFKDVFCY